MIQCATLGISKGMKNAVSTSIAFCLDFLIRNDNIISEECKTKKPFEIILHVGRVTSLPLQPDSYIDQLVEIFLKLSTNTV